MRLFATTLYGELGAETEVEISVAVDNPSSNVHGEQQQRLDVIANDAFLRTGEWGGHLAGIVSEELDQPYPIPEVYPRGIYLLCISASG